MSAAFRLFALVAALAFAGSAAADDLGGEGFAVPSGPSWREVAPRLLLELRAVDAPVARGAIARQDVPHTRSVLLLRSEGDAPPRDLLVVEAAAWGKTVDELFARALENLERDFPTSLRETPDLGNGVRVKLFYGEHRFAVGHALRIDEHSECEGKRGALVSVPNQHGFLCYPINSSRAFHGFIAMVQLAADIYRGGENPVVPHVYWVHRDAWEAQVVRFERDVPMPVQTPGFEELLRSLERDIHDPRKRRW